MFQFTHPGKGATATAGATAVSMVEFQFTHPGKGATEVLLPARLLLPVSIHAPWEGCDVAATLERYTPEFQFTHPGKGATLPLR